MTHRWLMSNSNAQEECLRLIRECKKYGLIRDAQIARSLCFLQINPDDGELREQICESVAEAQLRELIDPDPYRATNPISPHDLPGSILLGAIPPIGIPWLITPEMLTNHLLICGRSGGGKTNVILLILAQLLEMRKNAQDI